MPSIGHQYASDKEAKESADVRLARQPKTFFLRACRGLFTIGVSILKSRGTMWKNDSFTLFVLLLD
jgi:hypothetical protein